MLLFNSIFLQNLFFYSGKLTSPKWKQFRGMHLKVVDKVRLNNVIWREWVMQCKYMYIVVNCPMESSILINLDKVIYSFRSVWCTFSFLLYPSPPTHKLCGGVYCFHVVHPSVCPSLTLCFFLIS